MNTPDVPVTQSNEHYLAQIGQTVESALLALQLSGGAFIDEPPGVARGMRFECEDGSIVLFVSRIDPEFRAFNETREWDRDAFGRARVIGVRVSRGERTTDLGEIPEGLGPLS